MPNKSGRNSILKASLKKKSLTPNQTNTRIEVDNYTSPLTITTPPDDTIPKPLTPESNKNDVSTATESHRRRKGHVATSSNPTAILNLD